jgi:hypothetical protein
MDSAKAVALVARNGGSILDYVPMLRAKRRGITEALPVLCISTTAGTGSEVTMFAVVTIPETKEKPGLGYPCMYAKVAIVDPELTVSVPEGHRGSRMVLFSRMENSLSNGDEFRTVFLPREEWFSNTPVALQRSIESSRRCRMHLASDSGYSSPWGPPHPAG